jgi:hypothetical protein
MDNRPQSGILLQNTDENGGDAAVISVFIRKRLNNAMCLPVKKPAYAGFFIVFLWLIIFSSNLLL